MRAGKSRDCCCCCVLGVSLLSSAPPFLRFPTPFPFPFPFPWGARKLQGGQQTPFKVFQTTSPQLPLKSLRSICRIKPASSHRPLFGDGRFLEKDTEGKASLLFSLFSPFCTPALPLSQSEWNEQFWKRPEGPGESPTGAWVLGKGCVCLFIVLASVLLWMATWVCLSGEAHLLCLCCTTRTSGRTTRHRHTQKANDSTNTDQRSMLKIAPSLSLS